MGKKPGPRIKLTDELQKKLCSLLSIGVPIEDACTECGISERTFHYWQSRAVDNNERRFLQFLQAVERAKSQSKIRSLARIDKAAADDWRADAWLLERRFPHEFGKRDQVKIHEAEKGEEFAPSHSNLLDVLERLEDEYQKDMEEK